SRRLVGFSRDISVISNEEYEALNAPSALQWFPSDLMHTDLQYSGIYEDGWIAESSYAVLEPKQDESTLLASISIPVLHGQPACSRAVLLLDGKEVAMQSTDSRSLIFKIPFRGRGKHRVELRLDRHAYFPAPDERPVSAHIQYLGFQSSAAGSRSSSSNN